MAEDRVLITGYAAVGGRSHAVDATVDKRTALCGTHVTSTLAVLRFDPQSVVACKRCKARV